MPGGPDVELSLQGCMGLTRVLQAEGLRGHRSRVLQRGHGRRLMSCEETGLCHFSLSAKQCCLLISIAAG